MKILIYTLAMLISGTMLAQEKSKDIKQETKEKTITYNNGESIKERKIKVITRQTSKVKLDSTDKNEINQKRVASAKKVETMVMVDDDANASYDLLSKETRYIKDDKNYKFIPNSKGFNIAFDNNNNKFIETSKAWSSQNKGSYIVKGETYNGIGYFNKQGHFVVEYYDAESQSLKKIKYQALKTNM
ncbi:hypothetical protein [Postechiella marina]